ncbi:unnamed protein product [Closterium sp. NIES-53]
MSERSKAWMLWSVAVQRVVESRDVVFHEGLSYKGWKKHGASTVGSSFQDPYTSSIFEGAWENLGEEVQEQQEEQKAAAPHHEESPTAGSTPDPNAPAHDPEQPQGQQQQQEKPQQLPQQHTPHVPVGRWQQLLHQQLSKLPRFPMKRVIWREKLQSLEQGEASPLRCTTRISQPHERFTPSAQYGCMHDHEVHDLEECMLVDADGGAHGLDFCLMGQVHEPKSVKEALSHHEWVESMREELESHKVNESFELVDPACVPPGMEVLRFQWVWKYKHKADGRIERPKSRLVAMGNTQTWGVHYDQWYLKFDEVLMDFGSERSECDPALYHLVRDEGRLSLYLYVDEILLMSSSMVLLDDVKGLLSSRFCMKDLGEAKYYLGVQIERDESCILIHQERYILNMLESFGLSEANPVRTPLPTGFDVHAHAEEPLLRDELVQLYQSILGSLMFASTTTQPQIAYAVSQLSKVVSCPKAFHLQAAQRVLRYLKGCVKSGIFYPAHSKPQVELVGFSDADYAGDSADRKSHTGYVYCLNGSAISWQSKRQPVVALSTTESEYISTCQCIQEGVWLKRLFGEFGHEFASGVPVFVDNQSAIALAHNACLHGRTKHMQVRWHFIREMVASGEVILRWCPTNRQAADILTKPLPFERHSVCMSLMGMQPHLNLWPRVSLPETSPTLLWTGKVGDASRFRDWGARAFVRDTAADKLSPRAIPCVFLGFVPDAPGWQFYDPASRRVFASQDVTFDESVPFYRLFPYRTALPPPPPLFLAPGPPQVDPLPAPGPAPSGVSQVDPPAPAPIEVTGDLLRAGFDLAPNKHQHTFATHYNTFGVASLAFWLRELYAMFRRSRRT